MTRKRRSGRRAFAALGALLVISSPVVGCKSSGPSTPSGPSAAADPTDPDGPTASKPSEATSPTRNPTVDDLAGFFNRGSEEDMKRLAGALSRGDSAAVTAQVSTTPQAGVALSVTGQLVDEHGGPLVGWTIATFEVDNGKVILRTDSQGVVQFEGVTDESGRFRFSVVTTRLIGDTPSFCLAAYPREEQTVVLEQRVIRYCHTRLADVVPESQRKDILMLIIDRSVSDLSLDSALKGPIAVGGER